MKTYLNLLDHVLTHGVQTKNRTGIDTLAVFGYQMRFDLAEGLPIVTTKRIHLKSVIHELLWFLSGASHIKYLQDNGVTIWDEWTKPGGFVGPLYGYQWRHWPGFDEDTDQIAGLIHTLKTNPTSRRMLVSAWNVSDLSQMSLPPCHFAFQCQVVNNKLNLHVFLRSLDIFLGAPFDIASYALLTMLLCHQTNLAMGELLVTSTDTHLYCNHIVQAKIQLKRKPFDLPQFVLQKEVASIDDYTYEDIRGAIRGYTSHLPIAAEVAV